MKPYLYETHLHTAPVSRCGRADVEQTLTYYKEAGYAGLFITNHFLDGNANVDRSTPWKDQLDFYFSDYHKAKELGDKIGLEVFFGIESSNGGADFLVYGLKESFYYLHPEIVDMTPRQKLHLFRENGGIVVHAHPYREASYIDHIHLFPRDVDGVEIVNACNNDVANTLAAFYAEQYGLAPFAGTDNHMAGYNPVYAGIATDTSIGSIEHFMDMFRKGEYEVFVRDGYKEEN